MVSDLEEQIEAGSSGPRELKEPGSPLWCWQTISHLQTLWQAVSVDIEMYERTWSEAEEHKVWEKVPYDIPYGTKEAMLERLAIGDKEEARKRLIKKALATLPLSQNGVKRTERSYSEHLTARIARDRPDILERMKRGEFPSVAAAAREAGIAWVNTKRIRLPLNGDKSNLARSIRDHFGPDEFREFAREVNQLLEE